MSACRNPLPEWFPRWEAWRRAGGIPKDRPRRLPARIPQWAWDCLRERQPKPPTQPYWMGGKPGLFVTYGWQKNLWSATELVAEAKARGFYWIATQAEATTSAQAAAFTVACRNALIMPGVWESAVDYGSPARVAIGYDFYIGQVEGPGQWARLASSRKSFAVAHPGKLAAVVTNFGGMDDPPGADPFISDGWFCIPECWVKTDPNTTPAAQVDYAHRVLSWPLEMVAPMAGLGENGATMADYPDIQTFPGYSIFSAEVLFA